MTDLAPGGATSRSCPACGAQNPIDLTACEHCGAPLVDEEGRDAERDDLETIEAERAVSTAGFDAVFGVEVADGARPQPLLTCPECGHRFRISQVDTHDELAAIDTAAGGVDTEVVTLNCPECHTPGHAVLGLPEPTAPREAPNDGVS